MYNTCYVRVSSIHVSLRTCNVGHERTRWALQHCCNCSRPWHRYNGAASMYSLTSHVLTHLWRAAACLDFVWSDRRSFRPKRSTVLELLPALSRTHSGLEPKDDAARAIWPATDHPRDPNLDAVVRCAPTHRTHHHDVTRAIGFPSSSSVLCILICRHSCGVSLFALIRPHVSRKKRVSLMPTKDQRLQDPQI